MAVSEFGIGARLPRLEDERFLEGRGQFCADIALPGMVHAAFVRSPHAHARILSVRKPRDFAALVEVEFEALPPVVTMADALKKTPPFVHDDWGDNILVDIKLEGGDLAGAKANAVHIVERTFRMNRMHPLSLEGRACLAHYDS